MSRPCASTQRFLKSPGRGRRPIGPVHLARARNSIWRLKTVPIVPRKEAQLNTRQSIRAEHRPRGEPSWQASNATVQSDRRWRLAPAPSAYFGAVDALVVANRLAPVFLWGTCRDPCLHLENSCYPLRRSKGASMTVSFAYRRGVLMGLSALGLFSASAGMAARNIQIDQDDKPNTVVCDSSGCSLDLRLQGSGAVQRVNVSPNGFIEFIDFSGSLARFSIAESATSYQIFGNFTLLPSGRIDFVNFYAPGNNNQSDPDFQVQFFGVAPTGTGRAGASVTGKDLEITFAYGNPPSGGVNRVAPGATIGFNGNTLGLQQGTGMASGLTFAGFPAQRSVTNSNGLLLGQRATDSQFSFVVGNYPDTNFETVVGLVSQEFSRSFAAAVPEPSTWGLMILGFGMVGGAMRSARRRQKDTVSCA